MIYFVKMNLQHQPTTPSVFFATEMMHFLLCDDELMDKDGSKEKEKRARRTAVLEAVLFDGHLLGQLGQRLVDGVTPSQCLREAPLEALHFLHGALGEGGPEENKSRGTDA